MANWSNRDYLSFFILGSISFAALILLGVFLPAPTGSSFLLWLALLTIVLFLKNRATLKTAFPLSALIFAVNVYPSIAGSPLFSGTWLVYVVAFLFSPAYSFFPPLFPILLLAISFLLKNRNIDFGLKAVALSYIGFSVAFAIYWSYAVSLAYPDYVVPPK